MGAVFTEFPILESADYVLKRVESDHLEDLFGIYSNDRVFEHCGIIPKHNLATVRNMIGHFERDFHKQTRIKWGIYPKQDSGRLLGIMEAFDFNQKVGMVSIGYFLAEAHWGRGIATQAVGPVVSFLFEQAGVNRIQAEVMPANESSKRVLLKHGFTREGLLRQAAVWSGKGVVDLEIYGLLRQEYGGGLAG